MADSTKVLVVEDDTDVQACIRRMLGDVGMTVSVADNGVSALRMLKAETYDLILADIAMPEMNGYQLFEHVTQNSTWVHIPFVFLTARSYDSDIRYGKSLGVDDYITKPFRAEDLLSVVQGALLRARRRRTSAPGALHPATTASDDDVLTLGGLTIDPNRFTVKLDDENIQLSSREFRLLHCLADNCTRVVGMEDLVAATHDLKTSYPEASNLVRPLVRSVRRKLGFGQGDWGLIRSVRGVGYQLVLP